LALKPGQEYEDILLLSYYRNMLLHIFASEALVCACLASEGHLASRSSVGLPILT
jgi:glycerol-3-phosphate O-acyltransferase